MAGFLQRLVVSMFPGAEAESRRWISECSCGHQWSAWDLGGVRYGASGTAARLGRCPACQRMGFHPFRLRDRELGTLQADAAAELDVWRTNVRLRGFLGLLPGKLLGVVIQAHSVGIGATRFSAAEIAGCRVVGATLVVDRVDAEPFATGRLEAPGRELEVIASRIRSVALSPEEREAERAARERIVAEHARLSARAHSER